MTSNAKETIRKHYKMLVAIRRAKAGNTQAIAESRQKALDAIFWVRKP